MGSGLICGAQAMATASAESSDVVVETNQDPVSEEEKSLGTTSESSSDSDSDSNGDSDSTGESSSKSQPPPADEPSSSTPPAVKRVRAAVDGLDPDSPRVKRVLARVAQYRAKKADESVVPSRPK